MAYKTTNNNSEDLDKHLKLENRLSKDSKPVKIGEDVTGLQLSDKNVKIEGNLEIGGDIQVNGEIDGGSSINTLIGTTTIGSASETNFYFAGNTMYIGEPTSFGLSDGSMVTMGAVAGLGSTFTALRLHSREDYADNFTILVSTSGNTKLMTTDSDALAADITIEADGNVILNADNGYITLDSASGQWKAMIGSVEYSVTDSAYAGMILGYTRIQNDDTDSGDANITVNSSSMTVLQTVAGTNLSINFKAPPSGNVEIQCSFWMAGISDGAKFSLSTGTSYAELDETHTYDADQNIYIDETDHNYNTICFSVTGLTAGTATTYYLAGLASGAGVFIAHGRNRTGGTHYPPIILKAIALPATITTGE